MENQTNKDDYQKNDKLLAFRCYAALLDYIVYFTLFYGYLYLFGHVESGGRLEVNGIGHLFILFSIWMIVFPYMESKFGYTLGKGLFDLKVVYEDKKEYPFMCSLKRHVLDIIDFPFFGAIGILLIKFGPEHKRVGDYWGKTTVVFEE